MQEAFYQANNKRLESVLANLLRDPRYFDLTGGSSNNQQWLSKVYNDLLHRSIGDATSTQQLNFLNSQPLSKLSDARYQVALQILNSTEYRQILVAGFFNTYLGRSKPFQPNGNDGEVNAFVDLMNNQNATQETVLENMLRVPEYFLLHEGLTPSMTATPTTTSYTLLPTAGGVTFTATVAGSGGTPTGTVTFVIDGVGQGPATLDSNGQAVLSVPISGGSHLVEVIYSGDASFAASAATPQVVTASQGPETTTSVVPTSTLIAGQPITFLATVSALPPASGAASGFVVFYLDGVPQATVALNASGQAGFTSPALPAGNHTLVAAYQASPSFAASAGTFPFNLTATGGGGGGSGPVAGLPNEIFAVGAGTGTDAAVKVYNSDGSLRLSFFAYDATKIGVRTAVGDLNGDGFSDVVVSTLAGPGIANGHIRAFDGRTGALLASFFAMPGYVGGVFRCGGRRQRRRLRRHG